jgi:hypothetical protein
MEFVCFSSVGTSKGYGLEVWDLISGKRKGFLHSTSSRPAMRSTQPPIQLGAGRGKAAGSEADHSPLSNGKFKNDGAKLPLRNSSPWCGV